MSSDLVLDMKGNFIRVGDHVRLMWLHRPGMPMIAQVLAIHGRDSCTVVLTSGILEGIPTECDPKQLNKIMARRKTDGTNN